MFLRKICNLYFKPYSRGKNSLRVRTFL
jgi:hypothetical protein